jgi:hypothetical protein
MKTLFKISFFIGLCAFLFIAFILMRKGVEQKSYCGIVKHKIPYTRFDKHGTGHADPILVIDFEEKGLREIRPSWNSYENAVKGQRQCYYLNVLSDGWGIFYTFGGVIFALFTLIYGFADVYPKIKNLPK